MKRAQLAQRLQKAQSNKKSHKNIHDEEEEEEEEEEDYNEKKKKTSNSSKSPKSQKSQKSQKSLVEDFLNIELTQCKPKNPYVSVYSLHQMFKANLPSSLNSLIVIGTYFIYDKIILNENDCCENSSKLTDRPNFRFSVYIDDDSKHLIDSPYPYTTLQIIDILQHKFSKYIYFGFLDEKSNASSHSDALPFVLPKKGIDPYYNCLILPYLYRKNFTSFPDSFQYCFKSGELKDKKDDEKVINFLKKFTMKYQLRWIITINSEVDDETSCPLPNSALYIKRGKDKSTYIKFSNDSISEVGYDDIFQDQWEPIYFCYEKVPLSSEEKDKHHKLEESILKQKSE